LAASKGAFESVDLTMHKKPGAGKKTGARIDPAEITRRLRERTASRPANAGRPVRQSPRSVNDLLSRGTTLRQVARALPEQQAWSEWLRARLPADLAPHLVNAVPKGSAGAPRELVLLADSGAWCDRLRYAVQPLEDAIRERDGAIRRISVRVGR
jgi:hypothetical protein